MSEWIQRRARWTSTCDLRKSPMAFHHINCSLPKEGGEKTSRNVYIYTVSPRRGKTNNNLLESRSINLRMGGRTLERKILDGKRGVIQDFQDGTVRRFLCAAVGHRSQEDASWCERKQRKRRAFRLLNPHKPPREERRALRRILCDIYTFGGKRRFKVLQPIPVGRD